MGHGGLSPCAGLAVPQPVQQVTEDGEPLTILAPSMSWDRDCCTVEDCLSAVGIGNPWEGEVPGLTSLPPAVAKCFSLVAGRRGCACVCLNTMELQGGVQGCL